MWCCNCRDVVRIDRGAGVVDHHCFRHGLSWSLVGEPERWDLEVMASRIALVRAIGELLSLRSAIV